MVNALPSPGARHDWASALAACLANRFEYGTLGLGSSEPCRKRRAWLQPVSATPVPQAECSLSPPPPWHKQNAACLQHPRATDRMQPVRLDGRRCSNMRAPQAEPVHYWTHSPQGITIPGTPHVREKHDDLLGSHPHGAAPTAPGSSCSLPADLRLAGFDTPPWVALAGLAARCGRRAASAKRRGEPAWISGPLGRSFPTSERLGPCCYPSLGQAPASLSQHARSSRCGMTRSAACKHRVTYPEFQRARRCRLTVLALEVGGR